ncbi:MAG: hypothetical protein AB8B72_01680 [Crocinitomicaceae bacterium]
MNLSKIEALGILNITNAEDAEDAYNELLFSWKQKYMSVIPPNKVIYAHLKKIERLHSAGKLFLIFDSHNSLIIDWRFSREPLTVFMRSYQSALMKIKLLISNSRDGDELIVSIKFLVKLQKLAVSTLAKYCPELSADQLKDVKISAPSDFHSANKEIIEKDISETEIMNYLRAELKFGNYPFNSVLLNEVLKAKKQVE